MKISHMTCTINNEILKKLSHLKINPKNRMPTIGKHNHICTMNFSCLSNDQSIKEESMQAYLPLATHSIEGKMMRYLCKTGLCHKSVLHKP